MRFITGSLLVFFALLGAPVEAGTQGNLSSIDLIRASKRATAFPYETTPQMHGFPKIFPIDNLVIAPWNMRGVVFADLDGNSDLEVIYSYQNRFPPSDSEGFIVVWDKAGNMLPGFPVTTVGGAFFAPSVGDLDNDGDQEIVQVTVDSGDRARLYVIEHDGSVRDGFPIAAGRASIADGATLFNLDGDPQLEIIYVADDAAHVFEADGSEWTGGWPVPLKGSALGTPAVGDVDRDGLPEIFLTEWTLMHLLDVDGYELDGWPKEIAGATFAVLSSAALADLDHDLDLEIVVPALREDAQGESITEMHIFHHDGSSLPGWPQRERIEATECPPLVTDLEGDGELEILIGSELITILNSPPVTVHNAQIMAWDTAGVAKPGFPWTASEYTSAITLLTASDLNGDGTMEIFCDASLSDDGYGYIYGVDSAGQELSGFPLRPEGETTLNGAILGDVDGDGDLELGAISMVTGIGDLSFQVNLFDLSGQFLASHRDWPTFHGSNHRSGLYGSQAPVINMAQTELSIRYVR